MELHATSPDSRESPVQDDFRIPDIRFQLKLSMRRTYRTST
jgi:hypothetical protein